MTTELPIPETLYADSEGVSIAYHVFGSGAHDLVVIPGIVSHLEAQWQYDAYARMLRRGGIGHRLRGTRQPRAQGRAGRMALVSGSGGLR